MTCTIENTTFTGEQFIAALGGQLTAVGSFNAAAINTDVAANGDFSQVGIAATLLNKWIVSCNVSTNMVQGICDILRQGFKYMVLSMYYKLYLDTQRACGCVCADHEYATLKRLENNACTYFCQISDCLKLRYVAWLNISCVDTVQPKFDFSAFGVVGVTDNCLNNSYPHCDSCGC